VQAPQSGARSEPKANGVTTAGLVVRPTSKEDSIPSQPVTESRRHALARRALAGLCAATVVFLVARDLLVPEVRDTEVWLGFELHGPAAWLTAPLHWAIFAAGAFAAWRGKPWIWAAAAAYVLYVALSHVIWSEASPNGQGWRIGLLQAAGISAVAAALLALGRWARAAARD
jgi:hypothetical protein